MFSWGAPPRFLYGHPYTSAQQATATAMAEHVWRFGYGSNIGEKNLREKKNLNPARVVSGTIKGWELYFKKGFSP